MWIVIILAMAAVSLLGFVYVVTRITKFPVIREHFGKKTGYLLSFCILLLVLAGVSFWGSLWDAMIVFIHLLVFWLIAEIIFFLAGRIRKKKWVHYWAGYTAIAVTAVYMCLGAYHALHVVRTVYTVDVEPELGVDSFRIVGFSDSHMGTIFHADKLEEYVERMNQENPDIVVIVGDYVDDSSSYEDMVDGCKALGNLQAKYGVYYVFGNHDAGYYGAEHRGYGKDELVKNLENNQVIVMNDEVIPIAGNVYLCGREDSQQRNRKTMTQLAEEFTPENCVIVLDHEPNDYEAEAGAGVDLVISGHTHGGQFIPINRAGEWMGLNDMTYGSAKRERTHFLVSSGIADWAFKIKTGCISEYLVIDLI